MSGSVGELQAAVASCGYWLELEDAVELKARRDGGMPFETLVQEVARRVRPLTTDELRRLFRRPAPARQAP